MAILELDKIIFKKPDAGILCMHCGGDLKQIDRVSWIGKMVAFITLGKISIRHYQCDNCSKKYIIL